MEAPAMGIANIQKGKEFMDKWIGALGDICVIIFDLLLYSRMIALRKKSYLTRRRN